MILTECCEGMYRDVNKCRITEMTKVNNGQELMKLEPKFNSMLGKHMAIIRVVA